MIGQVHATCSTAENASGSTGTDEVAPPPHAAGARAQRVPAGIGGSSALHCASPRRGAISTSSSLALHAPWHRRPSSLKAKKTRLFSRGTCLLQHDRGNVPKQHGSAAPCAW